MKVKSRVLSLRLPLPERDRLEKLALRTGRTVGDLAARLLIEARRREDFAWIEFRDTAAGRVACLRGTRLQVWWLARLARQLKGNRRRLAEHLDLPLVQVTAALNYAEAFPDEMEAAIQDYEETTLVELKRQLPGLEVREVSKSRRKKERLP